MALTSEQARAEARYGQLFASPAEAARARRPGDLAVALFAGVVAFLTGWVAHGDNDVDGRVAQLLAEPPAWLDVVASAVFFLGGIYAVGLVLLVIVRGGRRRLTRDLLTALGLALLFTPVAARLASDNWPNAFPEFINIGEQPAFPGLRLALITTIVKVLAPHLTRPVRKLGDRTVMATAIAGLVIGAASVSGTIGGFAVGVALAAMTRFIFGSPAGLPSPGRLQIALAELGVTTTSLELFPDQEIGVARAEAWNGDERYLVKIHGRDAAEAELARKTWRSLWYREHGPTLSLSGLQQVEHEAVAILMAARRAAPVPELVTVGQDSNENAVLVTEWPEQKALRQIEQADLDDRDLDRAWTALAALHEAGVAHGSIGLDTVLLGNDGVVFADLSAATLSPEQLRVSLDRASMVASLACVVGSDRATDSMLRCLETDQLEQVVPLLHSAALDPVLRRDLKGEVRLGDITDRVHENSDVPETEPVQLRRIRWGDIVLVVFGIVAVNAILSQIAEIGFETLIEELSNANAGWLVVAFLIRLMTAIGDVMSLRGAVSVPVPTGPTMLLQTAKSFVGLTVPTTVGTVAMDVRYLQQLGVPTSIALAQGPLISFGGFLIEIALLLFSSWRVGEELELELVSEDSLGVFVIVVLVLGVVAFAALAAIPKLRALVVPPLQEALGAVSTIVRTPRRLLRILGGQLTTRLLGGLALAAVLAAFGQDVPFAAVIFVSTGVGLLAGLAPVPGGVGVAEALLTGLLTAVGVPAEIAFPVAITYRFVTSYLPPLLGFFTFRWLRDAGHL